MPQNTEYVVRWRRRLWQKSQSRLFQSGPRARRFADKLGSGGRPDLEPLVELRIEKRSVGPWKPSRIDVYQQRRAAGW
jgi:hypothetical protein